MKPQVNYFEIYDTLYRQGYHVGGLDGGKNHGRRFIPALLDYDWESLLEIGCSNGVVVKALQDAGREAHGVDASKTAVGLAMKNGCTNVTRESAHHLPFKDKTFDAVFSCDVLEHLTEADALLAIREIVRVTRKLICVVVDGKLERNREWLRIGRRANPKAFRKINNLHLTVWSIPKWIENFEKAGAKHISSEGDLQVFSV